MSEENVIQPHEQKRLAIFSKMTGDLQKVAKECWQLRGTMALQHLTNAWDTGNLVAKTRDEPHYGSNAVALLSGYLQMPEQRLYECQTIALNFDREEIENMANTPMSSGEFLSFMHAVVLGRIQNKRDRGKMLTRVCNESLSATQLLNEIEGRGLIPGERRGGAKTGRKPSSPVSPAAGAQEMRKEAQHFTGRIGVWDAVCDKLEEMKPEDVGEGLRKSLQEAWEEFVKLDRAFKAYKDRYGATLTKIQETAAAEPGAEASTDGVSEDEPAGQDADGAGEADANHASKEEPLDVWEED